MLIDLDNFKEINDNYGYECGDDLFKVFCEYVFKFIRKIDIFGCYGGEEFILCFFNMLVVEVKKVVNFIFDSY